MQIFKILFEEGYANNKSIFLNLNVDNIIYYNWISLLSECYKRELNKNDFILFNFLDNETKELFDSVSFKSKKIQKLINKHTMLISGGYLSPSITSIEENRVTDFLLNLPQNNGNEIPIFVSNLSILSKYSKYEEIIENIKSKGYFIVATIKNLESENISHLKKSFQHLFLMRMEYCSLFDKDLERELKNLKIGYCYYLKDLVLVKKKPLYFNFRKIKEVDYLPKVEKIENLLLMDNIRNF